MKYEVEYSITEVIEAQNPQAAEDIALEDSFGLNPKIISVTELVED